MTARRALQVLVAVLLVAGCAATTPTGIPGTTAPASAPSTPAAAAPTPSAVPTPTTAITPAPRPTATPRPIPPKPAGVRVQEEMESICDPDDPAALCGVGDSVFTVSWATPRARAVEIRVFGVTECDATDAHGVVIDGWCLREHTTLPASHRVLLASAPASRGRVTFRVAQDRRWYATLDGDRVYAFVLAAYNADGSHSIFAIADRAEYCMVANVACRGVDIEPEGFAPGSWMATTVDGVRVRSRPGVAADSERYTPLLPKGTEFGIVRGPVIADGYRWYLVRLTPGVLDGGVTRGWVADGSRTGRAWIENVGIDEG